LKSPATNALQKSLIKAWSGNDVDTPEFAESHDALRVWLRIMAIYKLVYREVHSRFHDGFGITLSKEQTFLTNGAAADIRAAERVRSRSPCKRVNEWRWEIS
jgi:hypothetical protein